MKIDNKKTYKDVLVEIGNRIKQYRISFPMTQDELSKKTGISVRSVVRIENGEDSSFSNIIKILMQLELVDNLNLLVVDPEDRPLYKFKKSQNKLRKRARKVNG